MFERTLSRQGSQQEEPGREGSALGLALEVRSAYLVPASLDMHNGVAH